MSTGAPWWDRARVLPVADVAMALGATVSRGMIAPCPACGALQREKTIRRGPVGIAREGTGWQCHASGCGARGDAIDLVSYALAKVRFRDLRIPGGGDVRAWFAVHGWADPEPGGRSAPPRAPLAVPGLPPPDPSTWEPDGVAPGELEEFWESCTQATEDSNVCSWAKSRGFDARDLAALDLARALPDDHLPAWVPEVGLPGPTWRRCYRLVVPLWSVGGKLQTLRFRAITEPPGRRPKALAVKGAPIGGSVLADPLGQALLRGEREDDGVGWSGSLIVTEGEPDVWTYATIARRTELRAVYPSAWTATGATWAVWGLVAGSWRPELAALVPDGTRVAVDTHADEAGDRYAEMVMKSLAGRCRVRRVTDSPGGGGEHGRT